MDALIPFVLLVAVIAAVGVGVGMLVARPLDRWSARDADANEEPGGDDRPDA